MKLFACMKLFVCGLLGLLALIGGGVARASQSYPAISPVGATISPGSSLQMSVVGLPSGVTVTSWSQDAPSFMGVSISSSGLVQKTSSSYGYSDNVHALLSNGTTLTTGLSISSTSGAGNPGTVIPPPGPASDAFTPSPSPFSGVIASVGDFVKSMVTNYGIPAILVAMVCVGLFLLKRFAQSTVH